MVNETKFTYPSRDGIHQIQAYKWQSDSVKPRAILQFVHGMQEHMERYSEFAEYLCENGFIVVGNDHLGHGLSAKDGEYGYFCKQDAATVVTRDVHRLKKLTQNDNPGLPYFIFGHSMGSFIARKYLIMYGTGIDGAIICGTGYMPGFVTGFGKGIAKFFGLFGKGHNYSKLIEKISFGSYNKHFKEENNPVAWVVRNEEVMNKYRNDPFCTFRFTTNGFHTLFSVFNEVNKKKNIAKMPKNLPVFFIAGSEDPVGNYGKGVKKAYELFKATDMKKVSIKIYPDMRHEIHSDIDRKEVYENVLSWLNSQIN